MPPKPTCPYCERTLADPRGCEYQDGDTRPVEYGQEQHPLSTSDRCRDCGAPMGTMHHVACLCSECPRCHGQFGLCFAIDCEAARSLVTGGAA